MRPPYQRNPFSFVQVSLRVPGISLDMVFLGFTFASRQESVPYSFPIFMDMEQSKQDFHAWMLGCSVRDVEDCFDAPKQRNMGVKSHVFSDGGGVGWGVWGVATITPLGSESVNLMTRDQASMPWRGKPFLPRLGSGIPQICGSRCPGNYLNKPEISRSSIFLCTNPIYYCNFFVGLNKTILGYFGLPLLYMVPHKDWSRRDGWDRSARVSANRPVWREVVSANVPMLGEAWEKHRRQRHKAEWKTLRLWSQTDTSPLAAITSHWSAWWPRGLKMFQDCFG